MIPKNAKQQTPDLKNRQKSSRNDSQEMAKSEINYT